MSLSIFKISFGIWIFNLLNANHDSWRIEILLIICIVIWIGSVLIDAGIYYRESCTPRTINMEGYKLLQNVCWVEQ